VGDLGFLDTGLLGEGIPVAGTLLVKGDDEVVNRLGLGRELSQDNSCASKGSSAKY
jgi:hypothetical protein